MTLRDIMGKARRLINYSKWTFVGTLIGGALRIPTQGWPLSILSCFLAFAVSLGLFLVIMPRRLW